MVCISKPSVLVGAEAEQKHHPCRLHARFGKRTHVGPEGRSVCPPIPFFYWHNNKNVLFLEDVHVYSEGT